jgi:hypothetical protein
MALLLDRLVMVSKVIAIIHLPVYFSNNFDFIFLLFFKARSIGWICPDSHDAALAIHTGTGTKLFPNEGLARIGAVKRLLDFHRQILPILIADFCNTASWLSEMPFSSSRLLPGLPQTPSTIIGRFYA